jgi:hypothetical protein
MEVKNKKIIRVNKPENMKRNIFYTLLFSAVLMLSQGSFAQKRLTPEQATDKMVAGRIYKPFPLTKRYHAINNGRTFDFSAHQKPVFLYVGEASCIICSFELPAYLDLCRQFPGIDFVYLSPDDTAAILKKFGKELQLKNLIVLPIPGYVLWDKDVARVYPVKYFIQKDGIVKDASTGGSLKDREKVREKWLAKLKALQRVAE